MTFYLVSHTHEMLSHHFEIVCYVNDLQIFIVFITVVDIDII